MVCSADISQNGAVPEGNQKSTTSAEDAQAARICILTGGRGSDTVNPSL